MKKQGNSLKLPKSLIATIGAEIWRLARMIEKVESAKKDVGIKYSIRKIMEALEKQGCSFIDLTGEVYDAGMAVDIIDTEGEKMNEKTDFIIKEMLSPIILFNGVLLSQGKVILERKSENSRNVQDNNP